MIGPIGPRGLKGEQGKQGTRGRRGVGRLHIEIGFLSLVVASAIGIGVMFFLFEQQRVELHNQVARVAAIAFQANRSLCLRKTEEQRAVVDAEAYLKLHPRGSKDIPRSLILKALQDDKAVLATLSDVTCPPLRAK